MLFHNDVMQAVEKVPVDLSVDLGESDMVTLVGCNFRSPKGVSALYVQPRCLSEGGGGSRVCFWTSGTLILGGG